MTTKSRRPRRTMLPATDAMPDSVEQPPATEQPDADQTPQPPTQSADTVQSRLDVLSTYADSDGFVPVIVRVSHDGVYKGQHALVPVSERSAGLIEIGFLEVDRSGHVSNLR